MVGGGKWILNCEIGEETTTLVDVVTRWQQAVGNEVVGGGVVQYKRGGGGDR